MSLLSTRDLSRHFGGLKAVENVDFELPAGQVRALIGPNGAGKTTFVGMLSGRIQASRGQIVFDGRDVTSEPAHRRIRAGMAYTFQITSVFGRLPVTENVALAVRWRTGGDEAALFAADLFQMYQRYAAARGWRFEVMEVSEIPIGGYKEAIASIAGADVFARLKFESGVHRVQRVPATESGGRIHTSAATVAVLPEAAEIDIAVDERDLRIDVYRASGPGGQSVNTTDSAVRITHLPTGLVVTQQDEKSQHKNRAKAMRILRARLFDLERSRQHEARAADRRGQVGSGDRSERVRTYNFPQGRITDHRINLTLYKIERVIAGEALDEIIDALTAEDQAARLAAIA